MQAKVNISTAILQWISRTVQLDTLPPQISEYLATTDFQSGGKGK